MEPRGDAWNSHTAHYYDTLRIQEEDRVTKFQPQNHSVLKPIEHKEEYGKHKPDENPQGSK